MLSVFALCAAAQNQQVEELIEKGVKQHDEGNYKAAINFYQQALEKDKASVLAHYEIASSYYAMKEYDKAIEHCDAVIDADKDYADKAFVLKGTVYDVMGKPAEAVKVYKKGIKKFPGKYLLHYNLALTCYNQKDDKQAERSLQDALTANPGHASSHMLMAYVMSDKGSRVRTMLALYNFLLLEPNSKRSVKAWDMLNKLTRKGVSKSGENTINISLDNSKDSEEFRAADLMVSMLEATRNLEENEKKSDEQMFVENSESFFKILGELEKKNRGFWWKFYVDFFNDLNNARHTEALCYYISQAAKKEAVNTWLDNNKTKIDSFGEWYKTYGRKF